MFSGSMVALVTPFSKGNVDVQALENLIESQINAGIDGILVCGTTGEGTLLLPREREVVIKTAVAKANKRVPIIVGCSSAWPAEIIPMIKHAEGLGADAALVITPYYVKPTQIGMLHHFAVIHDNTNIPIIMYNNPGRCKVNLAIEAVIELSKLPRIAGLKDSDPNLSRVTLIKHHIPDFKLFSGDDASYLGYLAHGGDGCMSVTANLEPALVKNLYTAFKERNIEEAQRIDRLLAPLNHALFLEPNPTPVKYAMFKRNLIKNEIRLPLMPPSEFVQKRLDAVLEKMAESTNTENKSSDSDTTNEKAA